MHVPGVAVARSKEAVAALAPAIDAATAGPKRLRRRVCPAANTRVLHVCARVSVMCRLVGGAENHLRKLEGRVVCSTQSVLVERRQHLYSTVSDGGKRKGEQTYCAFPFDCELAQHKDELAH